MNKRYLLVMRWFDHFNEEDIFQTSFFYTLEEAKITAEFQNKQKWSTTIIDLENENIKWQGDE
ncbi:hypothetical protein [Spiroplasma endosymbiont of Glossina fuscipes fuscipes]|uniref:hypothetical protein n=1 Tax=Spiroplasma endosymbiont of Glossina fuscipes fuscipes TaxID=2004463 RepID=UPI003CE70A76